MGTAGWIKLHRVMMESWFGRLPGDQFKIAVFLIIKANWTAGSAMSGGVRVEIPRGSLMTGRDALALSTGTSVQVVRTALKTLEAAGFLTIKTTKRYTLISIVNYDTYQDNDGLCNQNTNQQITHNQPTDNPQLTTIEEGKKGRREEVGEQRARAHHDPASSQPAQQPPTPQPSSESPAERYGRLYREWDARGRAIGGESWKPTAEFNMLHTIREALHDPRCLGLPDERIIHGLAMRAAEAEQKKRDGDLDPLRWYRLIWDGKRLSEAVAIPSEAAARAAPGRGQQAPARTKKTATQIAREKLQATGACL